MIENKKNCAEVVVDFFEYRIANSGLYKARQYILEKKDKISNEKDKNKKAKLNRAKQAKEDALIELRKKAPSTEIREWLDEVTDKDKKNAPIKTTHRASNATHILKFTHSSSSDESICLTAKSEDLLLTTSSLKKELVCDIAHSDGALISISRFLNLKLSSGRIIDLINEGEFSFFSTFSDSEQQIESWISVFSELVHKCQIQSADMAKQLYFPANDINRNSTSVETCYHLVIPLFASSLAEEIYQTISNIKYGETQKKIKECVAANGEKMPSYHSSEHYIVPDIAVQRFGGDFPRNVSMLNANRSGKAYLLPAQPPTWQSQIKPPINAKSWFYRGVPLKAYEKDIEYLRNFLLRFERIELSTKDPKRRNWLIKWGGRILGNVLFHAESIQNLPAGWSSATGVKLKLEHQYFLDPYRADSDFQTAKEASDWQNAVATDFAQWFNRKIQGRDKKFTPQVEHAQLWKGLMLQQLMKQNQMVKAVLAATKEEQL